MTEKPANWLGLEDFFNYYLAGLLWISDILILFEIFDHSSLIKFLEELGRINQAILAGLGILIPYILGLTLSFFSSVVHKIDKVLFGEPEVYVLDVLNKKTKNSSKLKRIFPIKLNKPLGRTITKNIKALAFKEFGHLPTQSLYFNIQYSLQFIPFPQIQANINRIKNLMNLHESFIPPVFLVVILLPFILFRRISGNYVLIAIIGLIPLIVFIGLWCRYHYFRVILAKRVYRYFYLWQTFFQSNHSHMTNRNIE